MGNLVLLFAASFLVSVVATRVALAVLRRKQILDRPNDRSSHTVPVPRGGGWGVVTALLVAWSWISLATGEMGTALILPGVLLLVAISWIDDLRGLPAGFRFGVQFVAAALGLVALPSDGLVFQGLLPFYADRALVLVLWVWFMNLFNFMDGIDGISGAQIGCMGVGMALIFAQMPDFVPQAELSIALAGAGAGFLVWNWHPAKLFLGDVGSVPLGFVCGWLLLSLAAAGYWAGALIIPAYYLADATLTLVRRLARGEKVWLPHRTHFYQKATATLSHDGVVLRITIANLALVALAATSATSGFISITIAAAIVAILLWHLSRQGNGGAK